ncbi:MAG: arginine--tRNA ligase [Elusimicrobia bacterium]|nr:arginine--tRNA ligase [Elusimicrobiota bacterium]
MYELKIKKCLEDFLGRKDLKLTVPPKGMKGDLSTNAAMVCQVDPSKVISELEKLDEVESAAKAGSGFVNIKVSDYAVNAELAEITSGTKYGRGSEKGNVVLEMVSSNPTGPLHIGHGRGAAIGDSLGRIYQWAGYNIYKEYYVNDAGRQMDLLGQSIFNRMNGKEVPENGYRGAYIDEIAASMGGCKSAGECTQKAGKMILDDHFRVLSKFDVEYDNVFSEKSLIENGDVDEIIDTLDKKGLTYKKDGALWFSSSKFGDDQDRVLIKKEGELTYFASDCAYHLDKSQRFTHLVNIWGADHHGYIPRIRAFWESMGLDRSGTMDIMIYQLVNLKRGDEKVSMSTRAGEFITLEEVIDEVGKDASRFFMLMRSPDSPLEFDMELAREESKKNPVYYVQYSHARICSVFRKAGIEFKSIDPGQAGGIGPEEREVVKVLAHFPYLVSKCAALKSPHLITEYLREVATVFHKYYDGVRVLGSGAMEKPRLILLEGVRRIIKTGLYLIGVSAPEKM